MALNATLPASLRLAAFSGSDSSDSTSNVNVDDDGNAVSADDEVDASGSCRPFAERFGDEGESGRLVDGPAAGSEDEAVSKSVEVDVLVSVDELSLRCQCGSASDRTHAAAAACALRRDAPERLDGIVQALTAEVKPPAREQCAPKFSRGR